MHRRATTILLTLMIIGATACGSTTDTLDSVDNPPTTPSEPGDDDVAETSPATPPATVAPPSSAADDRTATGDTTVDGATPPDTTPPDDTTPPSNTSSGGTAITQLSPQAVPSLVPDSTQPAQPASNEFPLDPNSAPVQATVADLAARLGVPITDVTVVDARAVTWGDSSLGCPQPGMRYLQRITDGSLVILNVGGVDYRYTGGTPLTLCE